MTDSNPARPLALVTGASSGIGAALAPLLARDGFDLLLVARRIELLRSAAERIERNVPRARVTPLALDLTTPHAVDVLIEHAENARLVVNNAGFGAVGRAIEHDVETSRRMIALNVTALTDVSLAFARRMAPGGMIVNIASMAAYAPVPFQCVYAATKAYVLSFTESLQYELRGRDIDVVAVCPGPTLTETNEHDPLGRQLAEGRRFFFMTAHEVAEHVASVARRAHARQVPGFLNTIASAALGWLPRRAGRWLLAQPYAAVVRARDGG